MKGSYNLVPSPTAPAITVDLWYTLIYQGAQERAAYERARRAAWEAEIRRTGAGARTASRLARQVELRGAPTPGETIDQRIAWLRRRTGWEVRGSALRRRLDRAANGARVHVLPGARRLLREARSDGVRIGLLSNVTYESPAAVRRLLARTDLARYFSVVALSNETGLAKPDPAAWRDCWRKLGVRDGSTIHIGDSRADVHGIPRPRGVPWLFVGAARWAPATERAGPMGVAASIPRFRSWAEVSNGLRRLGVLSHPPRGGSAP
jgi:FMN phosphatase YigB (HAD superfamily)